MYCFSYKWVFGRMGVLSASLLLVTALLCSAEAPAASAFSIQHRGISFDVYRLDKGEEQLLRFFWKRPDGTAYATIGRLNEDLKSRGERLQFATNGGIYSRELTPLGLYVEGGRQLALLSKGRGGGNFFLKPNGVFYVTRGGARVVETGRYKPKQTVINAVQSGPVLVLNGALHPRFIPGYHSRHIRNGVGVDQRGRVFFAISNQPVNFHDFGLLFRDELKCPNALYLDGTLSQMYLPGLNRGVRWAWKPFVTMIGLVDGTPPDRD